MAFRGSQDELGIGRRLLQRLQEGIERRLGEHVHLVDDEHLVSPHLRRNAHLVNEVADVLYGVVAGGIQLVDIQGTSLVEGAARFAFVASLALGRHVFTVDGFGEDTGTGGLSYATRAAEQVGMRQLILADSVFQRRRQSFLANHRVECRGTVLSGRNNEVFHSSDEFVCKDRVSRAKIQIIFDF